MKTQMHMITFSINYFLKIITSDMCDNKTSLEVADRNLCENFLDVQTFLNYVSLDNYDNFCLGYGFTARDFTDGTLGLGKYSNRLKYFISKLKFPSNILLSVGGEA